MIRSTATMPMVASLRTGTGTARSMGASVRAGTWRGPAVGQHPAGAQSLQVRVDLLRRQLADCDGKGEDVLSPPPSRHPALLELAFPQWPCLRRPAATSVVPDSHASVSLVRPSVSEELHAPFHPSLPVPLERRPFLGVAPRHCVLLFVFRPNITYCACTKEKRVWCCVVAADYACRAAALCKSDEGCGELLLRPSDVRTDGDTRYCCVCDALVDMDALPNLRHLLEAELRVLEDELRTVATAPRTCQCRGVGESGR